MFAPRYFAKNYFAGRFFPPVPQPVQPYDNTYPFVGTVDTNQRIAEVVGQSFNVAVAELRARGLAEQLDLAAQVQELTFSASISPASYQAAVQPLNSYSTMIEVVEDGPEADTQRVDAQVGISYPAVSGNITTNKPRATVD